MRLDLRKILTVYILTIITIVLSFFLVTVCNAQTITDTTVLKTAINTQIVPNTNRTITGGQMNRILNGFLNINRNNQKKYDSLYNYWRGAANGFASLGSDGKVLASQIPAISLVNTYIINSEAAMLALDVEPGDVAIRTDISTTFILSNFPASTLSNWWILLNPNVETDPTIYAWAKQTTKPSYSWSEISSKPTNLSSFTNDLGNYGGFLTSFTETDPTIYAWAKQTTKPSYSWSEIGSKPTNLSSFTNDLGNYGGFLTSFTETDPTIYTWAKQITKPSYSWSEIGSKPTNLSSFTNDLGNYGGFLTSFTETDPTIYTWAKQTTKPSYSWSEISSKPTNLSSFTNDLNETLATVTGRGNTTTNDITAGRIYSTQTNALIQAYDASGTSARLRAYSGSNYWDFAVKTTSNLTFDYGGVTKVTISNTGDITAGAISGTTGAFTHTTGSADRGLDVTYTYSGATTYGAVISNTSASSSIGYGLFVYSSGSATSYAIYSFTGLNYFGGASTFASTVTSTAFYESSDIRQKIVHKTVSSIDGIDAIQYTFKPNGTEKWGYSAQQVQKILPFAVTKGNDGFLKLDYTTVHTYKLSEHDTQIFKLENRISQLEKLLKI